MTNLQVAKEFFNKKILESECNSFIAINSLKYAYEKGTQVTEDNFKLLVQFNSDRFVYEKELSRIDLSLTMNYEEG